MRLEDQEVNKPNKTEKQNKKTLTKTGKKNTILIKYARVYRKK